jgi:hypothetical protein
MTARADAYAELGAVRQKCSDDSHFERVLEIAILSERYRTELKKAAISLATAASVSKFAGVVACARGGSVQAFGVEEGTSLADVVKGMQKIGFDVSAIESLASGTVAKATVDGPLPSAENLAALETKKPVRQPRSENGSWRKSLWSHGGQVLDATRSV